MAENDIQQQDPMIEMAKLREEINLIMSQLETDVDELKDRLEVNKLIDQGVQLVASRAGFAVGTGLGVIRKMLKRSA